MFAVRRSSVILRNASVLRSATVRGFADAAPSTPDAEEKGDPEVIDFIKKVEPMGTVYSCRLFERTK